MSNNQELVDRLVEELWDINETRELIEKTVEETKKHIAKRLVERYASLFELFAPHNAESLEEHLNESLEEL